ncbi:hypothetical protein apy_11670, partial [Aeropyrum pernix]
KYLKKEGKISSLDHLKYRLWPWLVWLDSNLDIAYLKLFKKDYLLILDRCIVDHVAGFEYLGYITRGARKLLLKYALKPDLIIILDAPPTTLYERKRETHDYTIDFYEKQRNRYLDIAKELKAPIVKTDRNLGDSLNEIIVHMLLHLSKPEDIVLHIVSDPLNEFNVQKFGLLFKNLDKLNLRYIITEASRNNVEFPLYERLYRYYHNGYVKKALEIVEAKYNEFFHTLAEIVDIFNTAGINYVVFKTIPPYKYLPRDIDVVIDEKDKRKAIELLRSHGYMVSKKHFLHKEISLTKYGIDVDLHWRVWWMGYRILDENTILRNLTTRRLKSALGEITVSLPSPTHEFLLVVAHSILQHHYVTLGEVHYIRALIKNYDIDWNLVFKVAEEAGLLSSFVSLIAIVVAKDMLFYDGNIQEKVKEFLESHLKEHSLSLIEILKPVTWLSLRSLPLKNLLNLMDILLTYYRKIRFAITGTLPFNVPLKEISELAR